MLVITEFEGTIWCCISFCFLVKNCKKCVLERHILPIYIQSSRLLVFHLQRSTYIHEWFVAVTSFYYRNFYIVSLFCRNQTVQFPVNEYQHRSFVIGKARKAMHFPVPGQQYSTWESVEIIRRHIAKDSGI
jgi:hypothetical protein